MAVHVEERDVAMQPLAHDVRHVAERQDVGRAIHRQPVLIAEPFTAFYFVQDVS